MTKKARKIGQIWTMDMIFIFSQAIRQTWYHTQAMFTLYRIVKWSVAETDPVQCEQEQLHRCVSGIKAMAIFTLYPTGFCSVSKVAPVQCEQELVFCFGAEIVPKR